MKPGSPAAKKRLRAVGVCLVFLALLSLAVGSQSHWLDLAIVYAWCMALLIGSILVLARTFRAPEKPPSAVGGQLGLLPRSWRRWMLDDRDSP